MALGIDLGSFDSKMVELIESNDAVQVKSMGTRPLFSDISTYSTEKLKGGVSLVHSPFFYGQNSLYLR